MDIIFQIIHYIGIISFAAAGAMVAIDHETDYFGIIFLSIITAFGGGLMRDVIAGRAIGLSIPMLFTSLDKEIIVCICTAIVMIILASIFKKHYIKDEAKVESINNILDALGLGVFTAEGTAAYLMAGPLVAITMGVVSSVGGSLTRDIILRDIPFILRKKIYVLACLGGAASYYIVATIFMKNMDPEYVSVISTLVCTIVVFFVRIFATVFELNIPKAIDFKKLREDMECEETEEEVAQTK